MNYDKWSKCANVIHRLSSRINNEQNQSIMVDNCDTVIPSCIDKSFYQSNSNFGQECRVEVCGNCSEKSGCMKNSNTNIFEKSKCGMKINRKILNANRSSRHQFALSKMFDNKRKYIEYVVTNVLRQVVNHIPFDALYQLTCCLPRTIEAFLCNVTDIDSDRLVRILVTEVLQCSGNNAGQLTDWYTFANSIKPLLPPTKTNDDDTDKANYIENQTSSNPKNPIQNRRSSERILKNHIESIFASKPTSPFYNKKEASENDSFNEISTSPKHMNTLSVNGTASNRITPKIISKATSPTSMSLQSKETATPMGSKYQSKKKPNQTFDVDKHYKVDSHESLPFRENQLNPNESHIQYQILSDSHHHNHKSDKSSDRSSSSDCVLTIRHKHRHKRTHDHRRQHHHDTTTGFDTPSSHSLSSHTSVPSKELIQRYRQISINGSSISIDTMPADTNLFQEASTNLVNTKPVDPLTDEKMRLFKLLASSDNAAEYLHQIVNPSFQPCLTNVTVPSADNEREVPRLVTEEEYQYSVVDNHQLPSVLVINGPNLLSSDNRSRLDTNSVSLEKKTVRINHYPNMLADFD